MISSPPSQPGRQHRAPAWHTAFLAMVPLIEAHARIVFRHVGPEVREEALAECVANALAASYRLLERGKRDLIYPGVLPRFAAWQVRDHRQVGGLLPCGSGFSEAW